jgi:hypothetical protein
MAAWRAERLGVGRNKPKRPISKQTGMPPGMIGDKGMVRLAAGGHDGGVYQMRQGHSSPQQRVRTAGARARILQRRSQLVSGAVIPVPRPDGQFL